MCTLVFDVYMFTARGGRIVLFEHMHELVFMHASVLIDGDNTCQLNYAGIRNGRITDVCTTVYTHA